MGFVSLNAARAVAWFLVMSGLVRSPVMCVIGLGVAGQPSSLGEHLYSVIPLFISNLETEQHFIVCFGRILMWQYH